MEQAPAKPALDLARCLNDAMEVYRKNVLTFVIAVILFDVLILCSLLVLAGPLIGGMVLMCLTAMRDPEHKARLGDLFGSFHRFGAFVGFFFLTTIPILLGYAILIIPGVILSAMWMFAPYLMVDRHMGVIDALRTSWRIVIARGFWINVAVAALITGTDARPVAVPLRRRDRRVVPRPAGVADQHVGVHPGSEGALRLVGVRPARVPGRPDGGNGANARNVVALAPSPCTPQHCPRA